MEFPLSEEKTLSSKRIYDGRIVHLRVDTVRLPSGCITEREIVEHRGAVGIVALDEGDNILLVEQFRKPMERQLLEIPAGTREKGEDALTCARRELREETGYRAQELVPLGGFYSSPGFLMEYLELFLSTQLIWDPLPAMRDEVIGVKRIPLEEALELVARGRICDAKSIIGLLMAWARLRKGEVGQ